MTTRERQLVYTQQMTIAMKRMIETLGRISSVVGLISLLGLGCGEVNYNKGNDGGAVDRGTPQDLSGPDPDLAADPDSGACGQADGPVKVLLMVDTSTSMMFTDPAALRKSAVEQLLKHFGARPQVSFALMSFSSWTMFAYNPASSTPREIFTRDQTALLQQASGLAVADGLTDLQSALNRGRALLEFDMSMLPDAQLKSTRYVVVLITDGNRGPVCQAGCDNDLLSDLGAECTGGACGVPPTPDYSFCDLPRDQWSDVLNLPPESYMVSAFPEMRTHCQEFNTQRLILQEVDAFAQLQQARAPGALELHTVRLLEQLGQDMLDLLDLHPTEDGALLQQLAAKVGGTFIDARAGKLESDRAGPRLAPLLHLGDGAVVDRG